MGQVIPLRGKPPPKPDEDCAVCPLLAVALMAAVELAFLHFTLGVF